MYGYLSSFALGTSYLYALNLPPRGLNYLRTVIRPFLSSDDSSAWTSASKTQSNYYKYKNMKKKYKYRMWLHHTEQNWSRPKHGHKVFADHIRLNLSSPPFSKSSNCNIRLLLYE